MLTCLLSKGKYHLRFDLQELLQQNYWQSYLFSWTQSSFFNNFILHFRDFQHTFMNNTNFNNFLTNNSINNSFSASFTLSSLKVERTCYAWAKKELLSPKIDPMAQGVAYQCSKVKCKDHLAIQAPHAVNAIYGRPCWTIPSPAKLNNINIVLYLGIVPRCKNDQVN